MYLYTMTVWICLFGKPLLETCSIFTQCYVVDLWRYAPPFSGSIGVINTSYSYIHNKGLCIRHLNIRSLKPKLDIYSFKIYLFILKHGFLMLTLFQNYILLNLTSHSDVIDSS